ncbi:MAG TPA: hypothetical protein VG860_02120 [Terriglobia bacterium]|jgi:hypothetical protein|nr:hypothetical protein [Terriglobia bacterium]
MTPNVPDSVLRVVTFDINEMGEMIRKVPKLDREEQLENTILQGLYPDIRVARLNIPSGRLEAFQEALVEHSMSNFEADGVRYRLVGASASAKSGKFYAVDERYERAIGARFQHWPQAAVTYFGILAGPCQVRIELPEARVMVVKDHDLGTNDCRGWLSHSLFLRLRAQHQAATLAREVARLTGTRGPLTPRENDFVVKEAQQNVRDMALPAHRLYQFRLAFDSTQAKGSFKVMADDVAEKLGADIILPESSVKPEYKRPSNFLDLFRTQQRKLEVRTSAGPVVLGIRDVSRPLQFQSSYTLVVHAPWDSFQLEIMPKALAEAERLRAAVNEGQWDQIIEILGGSMAQTPGEDGSEENAEYTSYEHTIVEAALKVDSTGSIALHPYVNDSLNRLLARWTFKLATGGGFRMPAFALADDGFLALCQGQVVSGSDWIPKDRAITSLPCERGLVVRYPIRMFEDLLPYQPLSTDDAVALAWSKIEEQTGGPIDPKFVVDLVQRQLKLKGTFTLHSETAARNGGDFDFDLIAVVEGDEEHFPRFVNSRFNHQERQITRKSKPAKRRSPWLNLAHVASEAKGNRIGSITNQMISCYPAGKIDEAYQLVDQLQNELDSLKWGTEVDQNVMTEIRKKVPLAPWLRLKDEERVSRMPLHVDVLETDKVGLLYNHVRKQVEDFFAARLAVTDFHGLIMGESFTREMSRECQLLARMYGKQVKELIEERERLEKALEQAEAELQAKRDDPDARHELYARRNGARSAVYVFKDRFRADFKALKSVIGSWADGKRENRRGWCQALHVVICGGHGNGSLLFYAFPQEVIDKIGERTGSSPIQVKVPETIDGQVRLDEDGRVFFVTPLPNGDGTTMPHEVLLMEIKDKGHIVRDGREVGRIRPFPLRAGTGEIRDGKLTFEHIRQRAGVRPPKNSQTRAEAVASVPPLLCGLCSRPLMLEPATGCVHDRCAAQASREG